MFKLKCVKPGTSGSTLKDCGDIEINAIELYRDFYMERFLPKLLKYGHSIWSISCVWHARMFDSNIYNSDLQKIPQDTGLTIRNATEAFVLGNKRI